MLAIALLIATCCLFIQETVGLEAIVALKTTDAVDIQALKNVPGVSSVYRVMPFLFWSPDGKGGELNHPWNYVVVGSGLKDGAAQDAMMSQVSGMDFVELFAGYKLSVPFGFGADKLNDIIKKADPKHFVKRPMKQASPKPYCPTIDLKKGDKLKLIAFQRMGEKDAATRMANELMLKIFPPLGLSYKYAGNVDSSRFWKLVSITDWVDTATWCEYVQSQWAKDAGPMFAKAFNAVADALAVEV